MFGTQVSLPECYLEFLVVGMKARKKQQHRLAILFIIDSCVALYCSQKLQVCKIHRDA